LQRRRPKEVVDGRDKPGHDGSIMTPDAFHRTALALPGATFDIKWGADHCYSVGGKMFAVAGMPGSSDLHYSFKASDLSFELLTAQGIALPTPYLARAKWVQVTPDALPDDQLAGYLAEAHRIVAAKLTRKARAALDL
jgi:predicted DNA-binding protein (MmcQ/YjbR family)